MTWAMGSGSTETRTFDPETDIDITGLEWWKVLQRLHQGTQAYGLGVLHDAPLSDEQAKELIATYRLKAWDRFDYVQGRPLKVGFHEDGARSWVSRVDLYNRNSMVEAETVIDELRAELAHE